MPPHLLSLRHALVALFVALAACLITVAHANALQDAGKLLKQGRTQQALEQVNAYLVGHPKDAEGRFLRGVILTEMDRSDEAIAIFSKLTEDYPNLPEPYNNLAVIYAQQKQYEKAKAALEAAIRTHPSYATAHENLGDIYARLASQAYDRALQFDSSSKTAQTKLSMIRDLIMVSAQGTATPPAPPATIAALAPKPVPPSAPAAKPVAPVAPAAKVAPEPATTNVDADVEKTIAAWASAWSRKDIDAYLAFYADDFKTPGGKSRAAWARERKQRVTKPGSISVVIESAHVVPEGTDRVVIKFLQHYKSATFSASNNKTLLMVRQDGQWKILQELVGG